MLLSQMTLRTDRICLLLLLVTARTHREPSTTVSGISQNSLAESIFYRPRTGLPVTQLDLHPVLVRARDEDV